MLSQILPSATDDAEEARLRYNENHSRPVPGYANDRLSIDEYEALAQVALRDADTWLARGNGKMAEVETRRASLALMFAQMQHDLEAKNLAKAAGREVVDALTTIPGQNELKGFADAINRSPPAYDLAALYVVAAYLAIEGARMGVVKAGPLRNALAETGRAGELGVIGRRNMDFQIVADSQGRRVGIFGQWENSTSKTPFHNETMGRIATDGAKSGNYLYFTVQRNLRTSVGRLEGLTNDDIPDVIGVRRDGRVDMWEVRSASQTRDELTTKLENIMNTLPAQRRGQILVIDPSGPAAGG